MNLITKRVPRKRIHYLHVIPRLQRLYASTRYTKYMTWHLKYRIEEHVLCHPSDEETWKDFDQTYLYFNVEPGNIRLSLCVMVLHFITSQHRHTLVGQWLLLSYILYWSFYDYPILVFINDHSGSSYSQGKNWCISPTINR